MGNPKALATVTAIIDGTGSIGAALGPFLAGAIPDWQTVFYLLMGSCGIAALVLLRITLTEFGVLRRRQVHI
jgi:MFS family permease